MANANNIAVLLSTYNGEKYIREQIDSILAQEGVRPDIYIRDDGSTDTTLDIIHEYEASSHVKIIPSDHNLGPGQSFMKLLFYVAALNEYNYYAFADQDDIWLPQKLKVAIEKLQGSGNSPSLYGSNRIIYKNGENKGLLFKNDLDNSLQRRIYRIEVAGCTMVFNDALVKQVVSHDPPTEIIDYRNHDAWIIWVALVTGDLVYDPDSYILYRLHDANVAGVKNPYPSILERINRHLKRRGKAFVSNLYSAPAKLLLEYYPNMSDNNKNILKKYANYKTSLENKFALMCDKELIARTGESPIIFKIKVLLNYL